MTPFKNSLGIYETSYQKGQNKIPTIDLAPKIGSGYVTESSNEYLHLKFKNKINLSATRCIRTKKSSDFKANKETHTLHTKSLVFFK